MEQDKRIENAEKKWFVSRMTFTKWKFNNKHIIHERLALIFLPWNLRKVFAYRIQYTTQDYILMKLGFT